MATLTVSCAIICGIAAIAGGFMDAISGGGGLVSITALLLCDVPPHMALGTNKVGALFGLGVSLWKFAATPFVVWRLAAYGIIFILIGSWIGAHIALHINPDILGKIMVAILPLAIIGVLLPHKKNDGNAAEFSQKRLWLVLPVFALAIGCYDGFFGPGSGSFLILGLHWFMGVSLLQASATAKPFNFASTLCASIYFIMKGALFWQLSIVMGLCFMAGNWAGASFAIHRGSKAVRIFLVLALVFLFASLIWRFFMDA